VEGDADSWKASLAQLGVGLLGGEPRRIRLVAGYSAQLGPHHVGLDDLLGCELLLLPRLAAETLQQLSLDWAQPVGVGMDLDLSTTHVEEGDESAGHSTSPFWPCGPIGESRRALPSARLGLTGGHVRSRGGITHGARQREDIGAQSMLGSTHGLPICGIRVRF